jgi:hypothetical protein
MSDLLKKSCLISSSPLIQISSLRRNNNVLTSVISNPFVQISCYTINRVLSNVLPSPMILSHMHTCPTHRTPNPFYIALCRQKSPALRQNYASELQQEMILHLSRACLTSCIQMVSHGRVHFAFSQGVIMLCIKNWGKIDLFQTTWTQFYRLLSQNTPVISEVNVFIHWMTHLSSTLVAWNCNSSLLPSKAWKFFYSIDHFPKAVSTFYPTQVHIQITISRYS